MPNSNVTSNPLSFVPVDPLELSGLQACHGELTSPSGSSVASLEIDSPTDKQHVVAGQVQMRDPPLGTGIRMPGILNSNGDRSEGDVSVERRGSTSDEDIRILKHQVSTLCDALLGNGGKLRRATATFYDSRAGSPRGSTGSADDNTPLDRKHSRFVDTSSYPRMTAKRTFYGKISRKSVMVPMANAVPSSTQDDLAGSLRSHVRFAESVESRDFDAYQLQDIQFETSQRVDTTAVRIDSNDAQSDAHHGFLAPFAPLHVTANLNTIADMLFVVVCVVLCVIMILTLHPRAADTFPTGNNFAPSWFILVVTLMELATVLWMYLKSVTRECDTGWRSDSTAVTQRKYFRRYFAMDLVYAFPLELVFMALPSVCYWSMIRHWLRWIRVFTIRHTDNPFDRSRFVLAFVAFLGVIVMIHHAAACIAWSYFDEDAEPGKDQLSYLDSLYWAVSTTTSTGYGDISPKQDGPRIVGMLIMISGGLLVAATTAFATSILTARDALAEEHDKKRKMMNSMLDHYEIPWALRQNVITMFPHVLQTQSERQFKAMMESMPSGLSRQLSQHVQAKMLRQVGVFHSISDAAKLLPLVDCLRQRFIEPREVIVEEGDDPLEMFFLIYGAVQVVKEVSVGEDIILSTLHSGATFGEIGVLTGAKRAASVVAIAACEVMVLTKEDLDAVLAEDEDLARYFEAQVESYNIKKPATSPVETSSN